MENNNGKKEYTNYSRILGRGKKEGKIALALVGEIQNMRTRVVTTGRLVEVEVKAYVMDKTLQYWFPDAKPHEDHAVSFRVAVTEQPAEQLLQYPPLFGQKALIEVSKPTLNTFQRKGAVDDFSIDGFGRVAPISDDRAYYKKVVDSPSPVYERVLRKPVTVRDAEGKIVDPKTLVGGGAAAPAAPQTATAATANTADMPNTQFQFPTGTIIDYDGLDDDLPF